MKNKKEVVFEPSQSDLITPKQVIEEEIYNIKEDSALIQYEMNMIELPFFSRDKNIGKGVGKKYIFSEGQYMEVTPPSTKESGYKIPQEFDEKIFYAILQLYRKQGSKKIISTVYELLSLAKLGTAKREYERVKESLDRLKGTQFVFKGILYDKEKRIRISDRTNEMILQSVRTREIKELNEEEKVIFGRDTSKKAVVVITLSDFLTRNIKAKGFLYYDSDKLIEVKNSTSRKLYLLITKWQGWEKKSDIRRSCRFLASRIPLSWDKTNIPGTINVLERATKDLVKRGLIGNYSLERYKPLSDSMMMFNFEGANNSAKAKAIIEENKKLSTKTGHEDSVIRSIENKAPVSNNEIIQGELFEFTETEEEKEKEKKLTEKAQKIISEMTEDSLQDLKKSAYNNVRYAVDKHQVTEGVKTEEKLLKEIMIMIIRNEISE